MTHITDETLCAVVADLQIDDIRNRLLEIVKDSTLEEWVFEDVHKILDIVNDLKHNSIERVRGAAHVRKVDTDVKVCALLSAPREDVSEHPVIKTHKSWWQSACEFSDDLADGATVCPNPLDKNAPWIYRGRTPLFPI